MGGEAGGRKKQGREGSGKYYAVLAWAWVLFVVGMWVYDDNVGRDELNIIMEDNGMASGRG